MAPKTAAVGGVVRVASDDSDRPDESEVRMATGEHERHGPYTTAGGLTVYWRGWALGTLVSAHVAELSRDNCMPGGPLDRQCWACGERDRLARVLKGGPVIATNDRGDPALLL